MAKQSKDAALISFSPLRGKKKEGGINIDSARHRQCGFPSRIPKAVSDYYYHPRCSTLHPRPLCVVLTGSRAESYRPFGAPYSMSGTKYIWQLIVYADQHYIIVVIRPCTKR